MVTPELIEYVRGEFSKGHTREEIHRILVSDGGWSEADINEVFRTVIPMQGSVGVSPLLKPDTKSKSYLGNIIFVLVGAGCIFLWWFYNPQITSFWNSSVSSVGKLSFSSFSFGKKDATLVATQQTQTLNANKIENPENAVKNCGISSAPDLKDPKTYENSSVLDCLGKSALLCENAIATLQDPLFPTVFQVVKNNNEATCSFALSYPPDSILADGTGKKLASQYVSCPMTVVKAVNETKKVAAFNAPNTNNPILYASQIYFYGTLGLFMETNLDQKKIQDLGCGGTYIDSFVASYHNMKETK